MNVVCVKDALDAAWVAAVTLVSTGASGACTPVICPTGPETLAAME